MFVGPVGIEPTTGNLANFYSRDAIRAFCLFDSFRPIPRISFGWFINYYLIPPVRRSTSDLFSCHPKVQLCSVVFGKGKVRH